MTEGDLMENIRTMTCYLRLWAFHDHDSRRSWGPGYPDLTLCGPGGVLFREVKGTGGVLSADQKGWLRALKAAGADAALWTPLDWDCGRIERELRALAG